MRREHAGGPSACLFCPLSECLCDSKARCWKYPSGATVVFALGGDTRAPLAAFVFRATNIPRALQRGETHAETILPAPSEEGALAVTPRLQLRGWRLGTLRRHVLNGKRPTKYRCWPPFCLAFDLLDPRRNVDKLKRTPMVVVPHHAGLSSYCSSKAGLTHLTRVLALEWARHGIRVNAVCPGYFRTEMNSDFFNTPSVSEADQLLQQLNDPSTWCMIWSAPPTAPFAPLSSSLAYTTVPFVRVTHTHCVTHVNARTHALTRHRAAQTTKSYRAIG